MLLEIQSLIWQLQEKIGNSAHVTFFVMGLGELIIRVDWIENGENIRYQRAFSTLDIQRAKDQKGYEEYLLELLIGKAKAGRMEKLYEMRTRIETEIRNARNALP